MTVHPRAFVDEYVQPAIDLWKTNQSKSHLAIHAISQIDVLAEVVAIWTLSKPGEALHQDKARSFRKDLEGRKAVLSIIRHAHDSHKHGILSRTKKEHVTQGQRPKTVEKAGFFAGVTSTESPLTPYTKVVIILDDTSEVDIYSLLMDAMDAWSSELQDMNL